MADDPKTTGAVMAKTDDAGFSERFLQALREERKQAVAQPMRWEYRDLFLHGEEGRKQLALAGQDGWEAVGVAMHGSQILVLLKRPLAPGRNAG